MKGDVQLTNRQNGNFRYSRQSSTQYCQSCGGTSSSFGTDNSVPGFIYFGGHTWQLSDRAFNEFAILYAESNQTTDPSPRYTPNGLSTSIGSARSSFPSFSWGASPGTSFNNLYEQFREAVTISAGDHLFKAGGGIPEPADSTCTTPVRPSGPERSRPISISTPPTPRSTINRLVNPVQFTATLPAFSPKNLSHTYIDPQARCLPGGVPRELFHSETKILQPPGYVVLLQAQNHVSRLIRLDDTRRPLADSVKLWMGESRGRWEGNTLVVDVANQNAKGRFDMIGNFATDNVRMVERWTIVGPDAIEYQVRVEDPAAYTRPFTIAARLKRERARSEPYADEALGGCVPRRRAERRAHGGAEGGGDEVSRAPTLTAAAPAAVSTPRKTSVQVLTLAAAVVLLVAIYLLPSPAPLERAGNVVPLTSEGQTCLGIMAFAVLLWVTETVPFAVTSLLVVLLIPSFGSRISVAWCAPASAIRSWRSSSACSCCRRRSRIQGWARGWST